MARPLMELAIEGYQANESLLIEQLANVLAQDLVHRAISVESAAKRNASGRPGPNVDTGRLRDSITWRLGFDERGPYVDIGSNVVYARRIELGFTGMDSLGRYYDQPPYPYLRPALEFARVATPTQ